MVIEEGSLPAISSFESGHAILQELIKVGRAGSIAGSLVISANVLVQCERQLEIEYVRPEDLILIGELERLRVADTAVGPLSDNVRLCPVQGGKVIPHAAREVCNEIRIGKLDSVQAIVINAVIDPRLARTNQVICNGRIVLVVAAEVSQQAVV